MRTPRFVFRTDGTSKVLCQYLVLKCSRIGEPFARSVRTKARNCFTIRLFAKFFRPHGGAAREYYESTNTGRCRTYYNRLRSNNNVRGGTAAAISFRINNAKNVVGGVY